MCLGLAYRVLQTSLASPCSDERTDECSKTWSSAGRDDRQLYPYVSYRSGQRFEVHFIRGSCLCATKEISKSPLNACYT